MGDITVDGMTRVFYVASIASIQSPTATELNAGLRLDKIMTPAGLMGYEADTADVDNSALSSKFSTTTIGRDSFSSTAYELKKQDVTDTAFATLVRGTKGFTVIRRDIDAETAWATGQACEVYPIICGRTKRITPGLNEVTKYQVPTKITLDPADRATVA